MGIRIFIICTTFLFVTSLSAQEVKQNNNVCKVSASAAGDEKSNSQYLYQLMKQKRQPSETGGGGVASRSWERKIIFPLRIGFIQHPHKKESTRQFAISRTIDILNEAFSVANIEFYIAQIDVIPSDLRIGDLQVGAYDIYDQFSKEHDVDDMISLYLFDYDDQLCKESSGGVSCGRTGGFSYILSNRTSNIVLSKFDLEDHKVVVHEFGHFFGLYHTFERDQFGKELVTGENCANSGDMICDTPSDPGPVYEVYVNYSKCRMLGYTDTDTDIDYSPLISNYMSYYKPCFMKQYTFTPMQLEVIRAAAESPLRMRFQER